MGRAGTSSACRGRVGGGRGTRIGVEEQVEVGAGAQLVRAALEPGRLQLLSPPVDPLIRGQDLGGRELAAGQGGVAAVLTPALDPGVAGRFLSPLAGFIRGDLHDGVGDRGPQPARAQPPGPAQDEGFGRPGFGGVQHHGRPGDDLDLGLAQHPGPERLLSAGQPYLQGVGQVQHRLRRVAGLGQRPADLIPGELPPALRHPRLALQRAAGRRAAADELRHRGMLEEARGRLSPVQGADQPDNLIIGGATEPLLVVGDPLGEPQQRRPARRDIQGLPGAEPARRAVGPAGDPARGPGLPGAAAAPGPGIGGGQRRQELPPVEIPGVGGIGGGELAGLGPDRGHVEVPGHGWMLGVVILLVRTRRLVFIEPGVLVRPGVRGSGS